MLRVLPPVNPTRLATKQLVAGCEKMLCRKYRVVLLFAQNLSVLLYLNGHFFRFPEGVRSQNL